MSTMPLAALSVRPPEPQPSPLEQVGRVAQLRDLLTTGQLRQGQLSLQQQQLKDQQALTDAMRDWDGKNYDALKQSVIARGGSGNAALAVEQHALNIRKTTSDIASSDAVTNAKNLDTYIKAHATVGDTLAGIEKVPDGQLHSAALNAVSSLVQAKLMDPDLGQQFAKGIQDIQDPNALRSQIDIFAKASMGAKAAGEQAKLDSEIKLNAASEELKRMEAAEKGSPLTHMENDPSQMAGEKLPAAMAYLQAKVADANADPVDRARATRLLSNATQTQTNELALDRSKKAAAQAIQDGDPVAAGKLLANGDVAPSQIISARKPEFAQKAFQAAHDVSGGQWNAQKAEADFQVARSQANLAFFGSAKSLTDKGGTLDQLAAAAKDIPAGQIPLFNSVADAIKASTGSGPIAKYAAIQLGVADDYAKVMGGGIATDTGRLQGLQLIPPKASPEGRDAAIEGIRGAVNSQKNSRIGGNPVLKKMYGGEGEATPAPAAAKRTITQAQLAQAAKDHNVSVEEATRQAKTKSIEVEGNP